MEPMSEAILIFTFGPIQPFIAEARRTADLYTGSQLLVRLSKAAAQELSTAGDLVYPASIGQDMPNKIVAKVPWSAANDHAQAASDALIAQWKSIAADARNKFEQNGPAVDDAWEQIWNRQVEYPWEIYWAAASLEGWSSPEQAYKEAYMEADHAVNSLKRTRKFPPSEEAGLKDTFSGQRQALRLNNQDAKAYWAGVSNLRDVSASKLRPEGRERLDTVALIKRFSPLNEDLKLPPYHRFPSTSSIASAAFLATARQRAGDALAAYRQQLDGLGVFKVSSHADWPYDGDFLYMETLSPPRFQEYQNRDVGETQINRLQKALDKVYQESGAHPSTYYAILALDGDSMGEHVSACLDQSDPEGEHKKLSESITRFSLAVPAICKSHQAYLVYSGGDDVLAFCPLHSAVPLAVELAEAFQTATGGSASAGLTFVHHTQPLGAALQAAKDAEKTAKQFPDEHTPLKNALCVQILKRSGAPIKVSSHWEDVSAYVPEVLDWLRKGSDEGGFSTGFIYDLNRSLYALPKASPAFEAELKRLVKRHSVDDRPAAIDKAIVKALMDWASKLPGEAQDLGQWLLAARFIVREGGK
jgi:CRISPR-associated protein Cmr2